MSAEPDYPIDIVDRYREIRVVEVAEDICNVTGCPAQPKVYVQYKVGGLAWCGHHFDELEPAIRARAVEVIDRRPLDEP